MMELQSRRRQMHIIILHFATTALISQTFLRSSADDNIHSELEVYSISRQGPNNTTNKNEVQHTQNVKLQGNKAVEREARKFWASSNFTSYEDLDNGNVNPARMLEEEVEWIDNETGKVYGRRQLSAFQRVNRSMKKLWNYIRLLCNQDRKLSLYMLKNKPEHFLLGIMATNLVKKWAKENNFSERRLRDRLLISETRLLQLMNLAQQYYRYYIPKSSKEDVLKNSAYDQASEILFHISRILENEDELQLKNLESGATHKYYEAEQHKADDGSGGGRDSLNSTDNSELIKYWQSMYLNHRNDTVGKDGDDEVGEVAKVSEVAKVGEVAEVGEVEDAGENDDNSAEESNDAAHEDVTNEHGAAIVERSYLDGIWYVVAGRIRCCADRMPVT